MKKQNKGFTLVELIVVITILAILGTIAIMAFSGYSKNARDSARIADITNMKKSLELWILQSGSYPEPTNGTGVTYSGATVWTQGTFGDSVTQTVGKLEKKPKDPLYDIEYTYSITTSKKEYQIGAVLEKDMAYNNPILPQTYAAGIGEAYVSGTYNGILTTVGTNPTYIIALPSIILSDITDAELIGTTNKLVYEGKTNLPSSYKVTGLTMTGTEFSFTPTVVWSGSTMNELNTQTGFQDLVKNLQTVYTNNSVFASLPEYTSIVTGDVTPSVTTMSFVKELMQTNTNTDLTNVATSYVSYAVNGVCGTVNGTAVGTIPTENLCTTGSATTVTGTGPWNWSCDGSNGGTNASCSAIKVICNDGETIVNNQCKDPNWDDVILLMHMDGQVGTSSFTDEKGHTFTVNGTPEISGTGMFGSTSGLFDLESLVTTSPDYDLGSGNFTVEFWLRNITPRSGSYIVRLGSTDAPGREDLGFIFSSNRLYVEKYSDSVKYTTQIIPENEWVHVAHVKNGGTRVIYINGQALGTTGNTNLSVSGYNNTFHIGGVSTAGFHGYIDEFRFTKGVARYTSNFTPPIQAYPNQ